MKRPLFFLLILLSMGLSSVGQAQLLDEKKMDSSIKQSLSARMVLIQVAELPGLDQKYPLSVDQAKRFRDILEPLSKLENLSLDSLEQVEKSFKTNLSKVQAEWMLAKLLGSKPFSERDLAKLTRASYQNIAYNPFRKGGFASDELGKALILLKKRTP